MGSLNNKVIAAYETGYRVVNGKVISPYSGNILKTRLKGPAHPYEQFSFHDSFGKNHNAAVHKLKAYQKFGEEAFAPGIEVRHLDGDSINNLGNNIGIGTRQDNELDKTPEVRLKSSITAATKLRKFTDAVMEEIREFHNGSYKETMETFGISSKATLHRILNVTYKTTVE